jgi:hypothetical protein
MAIPASGEAHAAPARKQAVTVARIQLRPANLGRRARCLTIPRAKMTASFACTFDSKRALGIENLEKMAAEQFVRPVGHARMQFD